MTTKQEIGLEFIEHHGIKGMHWGIRRQEKLDWGGRKARAERQAKKADKKLVKADASVVKRFNDPQQHARFKIDLHNEVNERVNAHIARINNKPAYVKAADAGTFHDDNHPTTKKYHQEIQDSYVRELNILASTLKSPSGNIKFSVKDNPDDFLGFSVEMHDSRVKHADTNNFRVEYVKDAKGLVTGLKLVKDSMQQAEEFITKFLEHHGVKGMQWGVRREELRSSRRGVQAARVEKRGAQELERRVSRKPTPIQVTDTIGKSSFSKTKIKAVGGEDHHAHDDAIKVAVSRQKLKRSGIHTLSNEELKEMNNRMNLEAQVHSLNSRRKKFVGQGFVDMHLAKAKQDPFGTIMKSHKINRVVRRAASTVAVAAVL